MVVVMEIFFYFGAFLATYFFICFEYLFAVNAYLLQPERCCQENFQFFKFFYKNRYNKVLANFKTLTVNVNYNWSSWISLSESFGFCLKVRLSSFFAFKR